MNRAERRDISKRKYISKLKSLYNSGWRHLSHEEDKINVSEEMTDKKYIAKSWQDLANNRFGILHKNTRTVIKGKMLNLEEVRRRNLHNRSLTKDEKEEAKEFVDELNNIYAFETYCGACMFYDTDDCPFRDEVFQSTDWKNDVKCNKFFD